jgi:hypothetical protein
VIASPSPLPRAWRVSAPLDRVGSNACVGAVELARQPAEIVFAVELAQQADPRAPAGDAYARSVQCGQALRAAWFDGATH